MDAIHDWIDSQVKSNDVVLFMKGTPTFPQCGFSGQVVQILDYLGVPYSGVNVLEFGRASAGHQDLLRLADDPAALREGRVRRRRRHHPRDVPGGRAEEPPGREGRASSRPDRLRPKPISIVDERSRVSIADDAKALIERGEAVVIDVREPSEIMASGMVPGAINIPLADFLAKTDPASPEREAALQPEKPVILYCASGKRSEFAGNKLLEFGYREVFNLGGLRIGNWPGCRWTTRTFRRNSTPSLLPLHPSREAFWARACRRARRIPQREFDERKSGRAARRAPALLGVRHHRGAPDGAQRHGDRRDPAGAAADGREPRRRRREHAAASAHRLHRRLRGVAARLRHDLGPFRTPPGAALRARRSTSSAAPARRSPATSSCCSRCAACRASAPAQRA